MDKSTEAARANGYIDGLKGANKRWSITPKERAAYDLGHNDGARVRSLGLPSSRQPNTGAIPTAARYEPETKTIRSVPGNHWLASMDSWDGAINHEATAEFLMYVDGYILRPNDECTIEGQAEILCTAPDGRTCVIKTGALTAFIEACLIERAQAIVARVP